MCRFLQAAVTIRRTFGDKKPRDAKYFPRKSKPSTRPARLVMGKFGGRGPRVSWLRTWRFAIVREVLDEQSSPVHGINFTADAVVKFRQLANKLPVIRLAAYLCKQNRGLINYRGSISGTDIEGKLPVST